MRVVDITQIYGGRCVVMQFLSTKIFCLLKYASRDIVNDNPYLKSNVLIKTAVSTSLIPVVMGWLRTAMITCRV